MKTYAGGCGRSDESVAHDAWTLFVSGMLALALVGGSLIGCAANAKSDLRNLPQGKDNTK